MKVLHVNQPSEFEAVLTSALNQVSDAYVLFYGSLIPETNKSWCSDCVIADPKIRSYTNASSEGILIECPVGDRASYKENLDHPYRAHPLVKLKAIPTLIHWTKDGPQKSLVEEECADDSLLSRFFRI